jgi:ferredoxin
MYIHPDECIDCGACVDACPVQAIREAIELTDADEIWVAINAERAPLLPVVRRKETPLPSAEMRRQALGF